MKKITKIICILLSFVMIWNSTSYLANAQETESEDTVVTEGVEDENILVTTSELSEDDESSDETAKDTVVDIEYLKNLTVSANVAEKSFTLQWEKEAEYEACEVAVYKNIDRSDETPVVVDVTDDIKDVEGTTEDVKAQEVVLDKDIFKEGTVYYIDVKPYKNMEDGTKEYGKTVSGATVLLAVPVITVTGGDTQCTINWEVVEGATKYEVCDASTGKVLQTVETNSATVTGLNNSATYNYQVRAIAELKDTTEEDATVYTYMSDLSVSVEGTTKIATPAQVTGLSITPCNLGATLKWTKVSNATSYEIYRYDTKTKKWSKIKTVTGTTYTNTGLVKNRKYTYKVRAVRTAGGKTATGSYSSTQVITAKKYVTGSVHPMYYYARVKSKTSLYKASSGSATAGKIAKGKKVTVLKRARGAKGRCYVKINGKGYWISRSKLNFYSCSYTSLDYTTDAKEQFVNSNGYSSSSKYLIWISSYTQRVNIFTGSKGKWKLYKTYRCVTGRPSASTPQGTYQINKKISRYGVRTYEKYLTCFYGLTSFHTRLYRNGKIVDARIGKPVSGGCIRLYTNEAKYIYDNMPKGTTVVSY